MGYSPLGFALETPRLSLQLRTAADAEWNLALLPAKTTLAYARSRLEAQEVAARQSGIGLLTIRRRPEGDVIGYCGLIIGRGSIDEPELAYELLPFAHGRGYATEAARAVVDAAFATGRTRIWSTVRSWNAASFRVLDKLAFRRDNSTVDERGELIWLVLSSTG